MQPTYSCFKNKNKSSEINQIKKVDLNRNSKNKYKVLPLKSHLNFKTSQRRKDF